ARRGHGSMCSEAHYQTARSVADEGIVLLQNKGGVLPLDLRRRPTVLVVGENAIKMMTVGGGSSSLKAQKEISPLAGLQARLKDVATVAYE
ncbi:glycosyl hydrolase, partial [Pseudomonas donghuensis]|nr:glycosyl hydrolase [Pseudomonas donghuensis]